MHRITMTLIGNTLVTVLLASALGMANAQQPPKGSAQKDRFILVRLPDRNPLPNQHLVIFCGVTATGARSHSERIDADTDARGVVTLLLNPNMRWFQVWHEVGKACPGGAGSDAVFHSSVLFDEGALVLDTCGPTLERLQPYSLNPPQVVHVPLKSPLR